MKRSFPLIVCLSLFSLPLIAVANDDEDSDKDVPEAKQFVTEHQKLFADFG